MRILLIMDPVETVIPARDTSLAILGAAATRGHAVHHCLASDVSLFDGSVHARCRAATPAPVLANGVSVGEAEDLPLDAFDVVLIRTDPPFDHEYLTLTLLLHHAPHDTIVLNDPRALREANEHLYALRFPDLVPPTVVTADARSIVEFVGRHRGAVIKPVDGHAGNGVIRLMPGDPNTNSLLEGATRKGRRAVVAQEYLPQIEHGDKRILLLDGEPLGAILRVPSPDDFRATIARGEVRACELSDADRRIIDTIGPQLRREGLWFVGIDVIDGRLTEVNVTSPTGLVQLATLTGVDAADAVIASLEGRVAGVARVGLAAQRRSTPPSPKPRAATCS